MSGFDVSLITLVSAANAYCNGAGDLLRDYRSMPTLRQAQAFTVGRPHAQSDPARGFHTVHRSPGAWFRSLVRRGAYGAYLRRGTLQHTTAEIAENVVAHHYAAPDQPDLWPPMSARSTADSFRMAAYVPTNAAWYMQILCPDAYELWTMRWEDLQFRRAVFSIQLSVRNVRGPLILFRHLIRQRQEALRYDLAEIKQRFQCALADIHEFSVDCAGGYCEKDFSVAAEALGSANPLTYCDTHGIVAADQYPLEAQQLIVAAQKAWVFGGMGSWNDQGDTVLQMERYREVSVALHSVVAEAWEAATNSYILVPPRIIS